MFLPHMIEFQNYDVRLTTIHTRMRTKILRNPPLFLKCSFPMANLLLLSMALVIGQQSLADFAMGVTTNVLRNSWMSPLTVRLSSSDVHRI